MFGSSFDARIMGDAFRKTTDLIYSCKPAAPIAIILTNLFTMFWGYISPIQAEGCLPAQGCLQAQGCLPAQGCLQAQGCLLAQGCLAQGCCQ